MSSEQASVVQRAFAALNAMDPADAERKEMRDAGISLRRVRSLYPLDFFDLAPALLAHVRTIDLGYLVDRGANLQNSRNLAAQTVQHLDREFQEFWGREHIMQRGATAEEMELEQYISEQVTKAQAISEPVAIELGQILPTVLWNGWWLMHHADLMGSKAYVSEQIMYSIATSHLPSLVVEHG